MQYKYNGANQKSLLNATKEGVLEIQTQLQLCVHVSSPCRIMISRKLMIAT